MWAALAGTAFASKASTAVVGLTILLAGAGTAEVTGIGPAVRESLGITQPATDDGGGDVDTLVLEGDELEAQNENAENGAEVASSEDAVGNLMTNVRPDGTFSLRGIFRVESIETSSGLLPLGEAEVTIPGRPSDDTPDLGTYDGYLVLVTGTCYTEALESENFNMEEDCTVESVQVLGQAGRGQPEDAGQPENPGQGVQPNSGQQPADAGKPDSTPPANAQGGNPNSD